MQIDDHQVGLVASGDGQGFSRLCGLPNLIAPLVEEAGQGLGVLGRRLLDDDAPRFGTRLRLRSCGMFCWVLMQAGVWRH
jgi:hypothetical protein